MMLAPTVASFAIFALIASGSPSTTEPLQASTIGPAGVQLIWGSGTRNLSKPTGRLPGSWSWSQYGQDAVVDKILKQRRGGFYLEIGGYDGELHSNTLFFEVRRGWRGLLVEANPFTFKQQVERDRQCAMVHACISKDVPSMEFKVGGGLTAATSLASPQHLNRIDGASKAYGSTPTWQGTGTTVTTKCVNLNTLVESINATHIDYFSLDVEGAEPHILKSIDWTRMKIDVLTIEVQQNRAHIHKFMSAVGYHRVEPSPLPIDDVYIRRDLGGFANLMHSSPSTMMRGRRTPRKGTSRPQSLAR
jgi:FkbM family methyltransferase